MKVDLYTHVGIYDNMVLVDKYNKAEAEIKRQILHLNHDVGPYPEPGTQESFIFSFTEVFGERGYKTDSGRLNVKIAYNAYDVRGERFRNSYFLSLRYWKLLKLRKSFGERWWQKSENLKWIISFIISLLAVGISVWSIIN